MFESLGQRPASVVSLSSQSFAHGLVCALTIVPAAGIFLSAYGSKQLPYIYILVAIVGALTSPLFARSLGRWSVATVARPVLLGLIALQLLSWIVIRVTGSPWPSIILEVLFPLTLQVGFVFLGSQGSRLLTLREMKAWFSIVASGFSVGFLIGGLVAPIIIDLTQSTEHVLLFTAAATALMLGLIIRTHSVFRSSLAISPSAKPLPKPLAKLRSTERANHASSEPRSLASNSVRPLVIWLISYQVLSSLGTQLADYLLYDRAVARYATSEQLARFTSHFNVGLNVIELLIMITIAGPLLARFGLRFGLGANPALVALAVIGVTIALGLSGVGSLAVFVAAGVARISDITCTNSTTRTSTNTAYQALPIGMRSVVQARIEGFAVPGAIGLSGVLLLIVRRLTSSGITGVLIITLLVCALWIGATVALYHQYRKQLSDNLRHRVLTPHLVAYGDAHTTELISLLLTDEVRSTRKEMTNQSGIDPAGFHDFDNTGKLAEELVTLTRHPSRTVRIEAIERLHDLLTPTDPRRQTIMDQTFRTIETEAQALRAALGTVGIASRVIEVRAALHDEVRSLLQLTLATLGFHLDVLIITQAQHWLINGDDRQRATALETIEVNAPRPYRPALKAVFQLDQFASTGKPDAAYAANEESSERAVLRDLVEDSRHIWNDSWLATCAQYALTGD